MSKNRKTNETVLKALRMKADLVEEIERIAEKENRNFSNMVNTMLMNAVDYGKSKDR